MRINLLPLIIITTASLSNTFGQTPFPANITVGIAKPGMNSAAKNYTIYTTTNPSNGTYTQGVSFTPAYDINGIGLNSTDNFIYGAAYVGTDNTENNLHGVSLRRIGSNGVMIDLGLIPTSGQTSVEFPNFSAGTVGTNNTYYYTTMGLKPSGVAKLATAQATSTQPDLDASDIRLFFCWINNLSTRPANPGVSLGTVTGFYELDFSGSNTAGSISETPLIEAMDAFLDQVNSNYPNIYNADGGLQDIAINPVDNKVYGYVSYPQGGTTVGRAVVMGAPVGGIAPITTVVPFQFNIAPGQEVSGLTFDQSGNFYGLFTTGDYAKINLSTGGLENMVMSGFATLNGNLRGDLGTSFTSTPLALKLTSFKGKNNGNVNELTWTTLEERNRNSFEIERSIDTKNWNAIGSVKAENKQFYNFTDNAPEKGTDFYRLKQYEVNGSYTYSDILSIISDSKIKIISYPNPVSDKLTISGLQQGTDIAVFNITGKKLLSFISSDDIMIISLSALPANTYIVQASSEGKIIYTEKIIKH
jgi:hypothetical protein